MPIDEPMDEHEMYEWGNPEPITRYVTSGDHAHANITVDPGLVTTTNQIAWNGDPSRMFTTDTNIRVNPPNIRNLPLDQYTEAELRDLWMTLSAYIDMKFPPKPPKFNSIEEADAWMEEHYG